jgi:broad specificity phosphatase PhoE
MCYLRKTLSIFFLMALSACTMGSGVSAPSQIFVMRHLQAGTGEDPALTDEGRRQALLLADWFRNSDHPRAIYVSRFRRAQETAAPLAARLGIRPTVYDPANSDALVATVKSDPGTVLIVGHSNTVPDIVERLGGARPEPIQHHQHGDIWRVTAGAGRADKLLLEPR